MLMSKSSEIRKRFEANLRAEISSLAFYLKILKADFLYGMREFGVCVH
jgi:hypothetical protein